MPRLRAVQSALLMLVAALSLPLCTAQDTRPTGNPYNRSLAEIESQFPSVDPPEMAALLARAFQLRDYVDDVSRVRRFMQAANAPNHAPLVRDEAAYYLARIDLAENRLTDARARLSALGFVRAWSVVGPFAAADGLNSHYGPEEGFRPGQSYSDASSRTRAWRTLPDSGPQMWANLSDLYPHEGNSVAFAATAVYSSVPQTVALRFSAEGPVMLFVNARQMQIHLTGEDSGFGFDQHVVAADLHVGWNTLLLKMVHSGEGTWRFGLRITGLKGGGIPLTASAVQTGAASSPPPSSAQATDLVEIARTAAEATPTSASAWETLGELETTHADGDALEHFEAAAQHAPTPARWLAVAQHCPDSNCVFRALNAALRLDPKNGPALVALAKYYSGRGQLEKARDLLRRAIEHSPDDFVARNTLIDLYVSVGLNAEALQAPQQLAQEFPSPLWLTRRLAARYLDQRQLGQAATLLQSALQSDFDNAQTRALLLRLYELQRNTAGLRVQYAEMLRLRPTDTAVLAELATLDAGENNFAGARDEMRKALEIAPEDDDLHVAFADVLQRENAGSAAQAELSAAFQHNPNREDARQRLELTAAGAEQTADDEAYLVDPAELAAAAQRTPPSATANAVTLANVRVEQVRDNGLSTVREQQIYYVASEQGARDFSTRNVQYAPGSQQLRILHARVYKRNGQVLQAEEAGEGGVADTSVAMYYDVRSRTLRYPALEPGDVVELDYRISPTTSVNPYGDYFGGLVVFRSKLPEQLQRYVLITPAERRFNVLEQRMNTARMTMRGDQRIYEWEARNQPALSSEPRGPALTDIAPYVHVSTFQSWEELGRWYSQLISPQFALDGALRDAYKNLLKNAHTEQERISAIHQFVLRNTHYVAMEFGVYSYKPYRVSQIYTRRFGDCKDKASLMIALLREAGVDADIALVRTRRLGAVDARATSIAQFNHAIVYLPKYKLWLDGTAEYSGSTELPLEDQGATALTVAADGTAMLRQIPVTQPGDNYSRRTVRAQVQRDGRIVFSGVAYTRGEDAPGLRREYESPERQRDAVQNSLAQIFPSVLLDHVQVQGADNLEHPITVEFRGEVNTFAGQASIPLAASWMQRSYVQELAALTSRAEDLLLPAPWTTEEELHFELPEGARVRMPADTVLTTPFGNATLRYQRSGREVIVRTSVQYRKLRISPEEYGQFRDFCQQVERAFHNEIKVELRG